MAANQQDFLSGYGCLYRTFVTGKLVLGFSWRKGSRRAGGHYTTITGQCGQASSAATLCPRENPQQPLLSWGSGSSLRGTARHFIGHPGLSSTSCYPPVPVGLPCKNDRRLCLLNSSFFRLPFPGIPPAASRATCAGSAAVGR